MSLVGLEQACQTQTTMRAAKATKLLKGPQVYTKKSFLGPQFTKLSSLKEFVYKLNIFST
jgi:hypothetical protein